MTRITRIAILILLLLTSSFFVELETNAQEATSVQCGSIVEGEFINNAERDEYTITLNAGDVVRITGTPLGETLQLTILVIGPTGQGVSASEFLGYVLPNPYIETPVLSANGQYKIWVGNTRITSVGDIDQRAPYLGGVGVYTLHIGCTKRDGTVINPGDNVPAPQPNTAPASGAFSLVPVDFSTVAKLPLIPAAPMGGGITPTGNETPAYTLEANAGDLVDLTFTRSAGNLNLGVVVLSPDNQIIFYGVLIASESLTTRLTLESAGQYTVGVFAMNITPPAAPEPTAFQIQAHLNS